MQLSSIERGTTGKLGREPLSGFVVIGQTVTERIDIRKKFLPVKAGRHQNPLPRDATMPASLEAFKAGLNEILGNLIYWEISLSTAGGCNWMAFKAPSNQNPSTVL